MTGEGALQFSPDNQWLALAASNSVKVVRWEKPTEEKVRARGAFLTFTPGGDALVRDADRIVKWNFRNGDETNLTPAGLTIVAVNAHGTVAALWEKSAPGATRPPRPPTDDSDPPGAIIVFDLVAQKRLAWLPTVRSVSPAVRFSADGRLLAFSDATGLDQGQQAVRIYDVAAGGYRRSLTGFRRSLGRSRNGGRGGAATIGSSTSMSRRRARFTADSSSATARCSPR